ncbi:hypothetical protein B0H16DRAFT_85603 [Mycena metata]|uniref:F-box domain-containing protein n=1 Tax=Mycena metata TaxID=1033252 RepID=A0AAD7NTX1_9AGAR|nr:hypothetical protein B0H16DRAFT_85603 [Mycena metata]
MSPEPIIRPSEDLVGSAVGFARLPPEIVMEIFTQCCSEQYPIHASEAVRISHVDSAWRNLALSMPTLWATFSIKIAQLVEPRLGGKHIHTRLNEGVLRLLDVHLERSAKSSLSFSVDLYTIDSEMMPAALDLLTPLVGHSDRWKFVKLPYVPEFAPLFARLIGRLGRLERLDLRVQEMHNDGVDRNYFAVAPRLRRLALGASLARNLPFPPNQLTELHLGAAPTMELSQFMTLCPCPYLTTLILNPYYPLQRQPAPQPLAPLLHLHTLILAIRDGYSRNPTIEVLDLLTAPSLQNLEVVGVREIQLPRQAFVAFLERSGCTLQALSITYKDNLPVPTLLSNLRAVPSLTHLAIFARGKEHTALDLILQSLTLSDASREPLLPNLTSFQLQATTFRATLVDMVASRLAYGLEPNISRLRELILRIPNTEAAHQLDTLISDKGLVVSYPPRYKRSTLFI